MSVSIRPLLWAVILQSPFVLGFGAQASDLGLTTEERAWLSQNSSVTVGVSSQGFPPFEETDQAGNLVGLGPDYLHLVTSKLGLKVELKRFSTWPEVFAAACAGHVDLMMNVALVPDRTNCLVFSRPYLDIPAVVIGKSALEPIDDSKLAVARVAVVGGTSTAVAVAERFPRAERVELESVEKALKAIIRGKADLYIGNPYVAYPFLSKSEFEELAVLRNADTPFSAFHFAVAERSKPLAGAISKALATITDEQSNEIRRRWLGSHDSPQDSRERRLVLSRRERDWIASVPPLRLGFNSSWDAISPESDGALGGVSGEYARILETRLGIRFVPVAVANQTELAKLVSQDRIDMVVTTRGRAVAAGWHPTASMLRLANVIVAKNDRRGVTNAGDLNGLKVATVGPGRQAHILNAAPTARVIQVDSALEGLRKVEQGDVDMYVGDVVNVNRTLREERIPLQIVAPAGFEEDVTFAISPRQRELAPLVNRVIGGFSEEDHQRIRSGWLQLNVQYGVRWRSVVAWMLLASLMAGILTFSYLNVRWAIAGREQALGLISELTRHLPGVVFKISVDPRGEISTVFIGGNLGGIFGVSAAQVHASTEVLLDRFDADDRLKLLATFRDQSPHPVLMNMVVGQRWVRLSAAPRAGKGSHVKWSGYWADATEEQAQLDALATAKVAAELAANTKATFLATMSHEIRTPMSGLAGLLELLGRSELLSEQRRMLELAIAAARSLRELLDDILDFSRIESGRLRVETSDMRPRDLLSEVSLLMLGVAEQKGVGFECHLDGRLAGVLRGDDARIRQIVINLLSNAIKFTEHGHVALRAILRSESDRMQFWTIEVSDTGVGIPEDELGSLFQPFAQAQSTSATRAGGSGLGLVIARRLAELMGGTLSLTSKVGRGTTAAFELRSAIVEMSDTHPALVGKSVYLECADAVVKAAIRANLNVLGISLVSGRRRADIVMTDRTGRTHDASPPVVVLTMATPLATLSTPLLSLACEPVLFTSVREVCLTALGACSVQQGSTEVSDESFNVDGNAPLILVAEDDPTSQILIRGQLLELGCLCHVAGDGVEALLCWESASYDLLITDMGMPRLDGLGLAREIRRREALTGARMPIVALTAAAFPEDAMRCHDAGMDDYLAKPASLGDVSARLRKWLVDKPARMNTAVNNRGMPSEVLLHSVTKAFCDDAQNLRDELDASIDSDDWQEMERAFHRIAGALACVGHTATAQRIKKLIVLIEADSLNAHRDELSAVYEDVLHCIAATVDPCRAK